METNPCWSPPCPPSRAVEAPVELESEAPDVLRSLFSVLRFRLENMSTKSVRVALGLEIGKDEAQGTATIAARVIDGDTPDNALKPRFIDAPKVSGVWVRTRSGRRGAGWQTIEVLAEVEGVWRVIQTHDVLETGGEISHITENLGLRDAPVDTNGGFP